MDRIEFSKQPHTADNWVGASLSDMISLASGIVQLQDSVIGPLLFLLLVNDIGDIYLVATVLLVKYTQMTLICYLQHFVYSVNYDIAHMQNSLNALYT